VKDKKPTMSEKLEREVVGGMGPLGQM